MLKFGKIQFTLEQCFLAIIIFVAAYLAIDKRFMQDDAYISFVYARNFAEGHGLRWYPGSNEYGYTNFLFTVVIGILMKFGLGPETASYLLTFPSAMILLLLVYGIGRRTIRSPIPVWAATVALAINHTFLSYATGGLETSFCICLVMAVYYQLVCWHQDKNSRRLRYIAAFSSLALLTRLDSALLLFPAYVFLLVTMLRNDMAQGRGIKTTILTMSWVSAIPTASVLAMLGFCHSYYGYAFPSTFEAKTGQWFVLQGFKYMYAFVKAQAYAPLILFAIWFFVVSEKDFVPSRWVYRGLIFSVIFIWLLYVLHVGGDFMEFRFLLPIMPFFYLLIFDLLVDEGKRAGKVFLTCIIGIMLFGNYVQPFYFQAKMMDKNLIESTGLLNRWMRGTNYNWHMLGQKLNEYFYTGKPTDVKIAVTGAGAIPYFSKLPAIDQHGLNTRSVIVEGGPVYQKRPGHRVKASNKLLRELDVNLIIDHPIFIRKRGDVYRCLSTTILITHEPLAKIPAVFLHLKDDYYVLAHYLTKHPRIDALIEEGKIVKHADVAKNTRCGKDFIIPALELPKSS
jgi:arabinofuranosyltransferase